MNDKNNTQTPEQRRAVNFFALRAAVAAYLIYLGFDLFRAYLIGASTLSPALAWICGPGFMAAGAAFILYSWRRYRRESAAAADKKGGDPDTDAKPDGEA